MTDDTAPSAAGPRTPAPPPSPPSDEENFTPGDVAPSLLLTMRIELENRPGVFARLATTIGLVDGNLGAMDIVAVDGRRIVRDINVSVTDEEHGNRVVEAVRTLPGIHLINVSDQVFSLHLGGKIRIQSRYPVNNRAIMSQVYTPGVARVAKAIAADPAKVHTLTIKRNTVAIVTDGSAVLGMGNIGPAAALPVMEGKAMLFKEFADIDAFPLCLATQDTEEIIATVRAIAPVFGGINLEDISAPRCFEIEERLRGMLDIPVFHDDQHGTGIVVLAALRNALRVVKKPLEEVRIVISGAGAAGCAVARILLRAGAKHIIGCDRAGAIHAGREEISGPTKEWFAVHTNRDGFGGSLAEAMVGADVLIGLSAPNLLGEEELRRMNRDAVVFALANPQPEVLPEVAWSVAKVVATGRSDYPNQVNNVLAFPGIFRGALDTNAVSITPEMEMAASEALADVVRPNELCAEYIVPSVFNPATAKQVASAVARAALKSGTVKRRPTAHMGAAGGGATD